jgi:hypothetical protein
MIRMPDRRCEIASRARTDDVFAEMCGAYFLAWTAYECWSKMLSANAETIVTEYVQAITELEEYFLMR